MIKTAAVTVTTQATKLYTPNASGREPGLGIPVLVRNNDASVTMYVGGSDVTTANGYPVKAGEFVSMEHAPGDILYGIVGTGSVEARVIRGKQ